MRAKKSLGQNFLMHARIAERIADTARIAPNAVVLEIGPGTGMLTRALLQRAGKVIAVEADYELFEKLQSDFAREIASGQLELIHGDIRDVYLNSRYSVKDGTSGKYEIVANIPYYLTGEIFRLFLESENQPSSITLLVQKEVAERVVVREKKPLDSARGKQSILSLSVKAYGTPKYEFTVKRGAFKPVPKVDSAVLTIRDISRKNFATNKEEELFFKLLHTGFAHKRKFVRRNLADAGLPQGDIPEKARAEDLSISDWLALCR
ncbi:ribosomal RNA small subunit methyltransferase A [Candidatus Kaiserbacteria bacterium RIFOXYD1_FULL_47_14]|uniref:Ribosomal RNA small subunit methyltransferase A n=1 Tax=Candidatus Kaiserbacteria bacterium RIFOXYD1_FULL_47_14 TaxID=1798533 RepID=A0A1F6G4F1_9BACT|nr:MAG: ribosomal RNA small subunit methyltransferase A [Candidatus Kaiserbacteria bacterium RIFOXYD1_FULL_47_14]